MVATDGPRDASVVVAKASAERPQRSLASLQSSIPPAKARFVFARPSKGDAEASFASILASEDRTETSDVNAQASFVSILAKQGRPETSFAFARPSKGDGEASFVSILAKQGRPEASFAFARP